MRRLRGVPDSVAVLSFQLLKTLENAGFDFTGHRLEVYGMIEAFVLELEKKQEDKQ